MTVVSANAVISKMRLRVLEVRALDLFSGERGYDVQREQRAVHEQQDARGVFHITQLLVEHVLE